MPLKPPGSSSGKNTMIGRLWSPARAMAGSIHHAQTFGQHIHHNDRFIAFCIRYFIGPCHRRHHLVPLKSPRRDILVRAGSRGIGREISAGARSQKMQTRFPSRCARAAAAIVTALHFVHVIAESHGVNCRDPTSVASCSAFIHRARHAHIVGSRPLHPLRRACRPRKIFAARKPIQISTRDTVYRLHSRASARTFGGVQAISLIAHQRRPNDLSIHRLTKGTGNYRT